MWFSIIFLINLLFLSELTEERKLTDKVNLSGVSQCVKARL